MRFEQISAKIWTVTTLLPFPVRVCLVKSDNGLTLIDAGMSLMGNSILRAIQEIGLPLEQIILTHGHNDHVGALRGIVSEFAVPVYVHPEEIPFILGERDYSELLKNRKRVSKRRPLIPDHLVHPVDLDRPIAGLHLYHTPGHSPGHIVLYSAEDEILMAGDLFITIGGKLRPPLPMFTPNMWQAFDSGCIVDKLQPKKMLVAHGPIIEKPSMMYDQYRQKYQTKYAGRGEQLTSFIR